MNGICSRAVFAVVAMSGAAVHARAQDQRKVSEPAIPPPCVTLAAANAWPVDETRPDTGRIQEAIDHCAPGHAVELKGDGTNNAFLSGPLTLRRGVALAIDKGTTLYASRDPRDYELSPGGCGVITEKGHGCRALINGDGVDDAGVMGDGAIDGRGGEKMLGSDLTWWQLADKARAGGFQNNPRLILLNRCNRFTLYRITLRNSPNFHVSFSDADGFTAWGVKIHSPKRARNTDGIDPANSTNVTIVNSWIDTGDDNVAIKAGMGRASTHMTIAHNHFYSGHGMSIGSETNAGVSAIRVSDLTIDGADNGIRIKSNVSRGGLVENIVYENVCIRNTKNPLLFDTHYTPLGPARNLIPQYKNITLRTVTIEGGGKITVDGFDAAHRLGIRYEQVRATERGALQIEVKNATAPDFSSGAGADACVSAFEPFPMARDLIRVSPDGSGDFRTVQEGVDAARPGSTIAVAPGTYREKVVVKTKGVTMRGAGRQPSDAVVVLDQSAGSTGSTFRSATVEIRADDFHASNITFANDFNRTHPQLPQGSQALALFVNGDRDVFRNVRLLGNQDTLYAASANCNPDGQPCMATRQYFADCYIEGNVDFIFGDGKAYFDRCEIHSTAHNGGYVTAQGKHYAQEDSGFVFRNCTLTAEPGVSGVFLGRPWRAWATVIFLGSTMGAHIAPQGWREWHPGDTNYLATVDYAEYDSKGPGAARESRDAHTHLLTAAEAEKYELARFLAGADGWNPEKVR